MKYECFLNAEKIQVAKFTYTEQNPLSEDFVHYDKGYNLSSPQGRKTIAEMGILMHQDSLPTLNKLESIYTQINARDGRIVEANLTVKELVGNTIQIIDYNIAGIHKTIPTELQQVTAAVNPENALVITFRLTLIRKSEFVTPLMLS